jgi:hypothetical protein
VVKADLFSRPVASGNLAAALAFATVHPFATIIADFAATLALAGIHALAVMFVHGSGGRACAGTAGCGLATGRGQGSGCQSRHSGGENECFRGFVHNIFLRIFVLIVFLLIRLTATSLRLGRCSIGK